MDDDARYRALVARDRRFDGRFFVAVASTHIYCRPICPAKTPGRAGVAFYETSEEAEAAGYRPCLRCRPETAPGVASVDAVPSLARSALRRIREGALDEGSVADLADEFGVTERHLARAVSRTYGAPPVRLARTRRLLLAKALLAETDLPAGEVALAAGFGSLRRFQAALQEAYGLSATDLRRRDGRRSPEVRLRLAYRPPLDWDAHLIYLNGRAIPGVETVADGIYRRSVRLGGRTGWISVAQDAGDALILTVDPELTPVLGRIVPRVRRMFDLDLDPAVVAAALGDLAAHPGLRLPRAFDPFETAVRAILGQVVTVARATQLAGKVAARYGVPIEGGLLFPDAATLAATDETEVAGLGITRARARTLIGLARAVADGTISLRPGSDPEQAVRELDALPGIGPWTAEYIAMRCLGWTDAFPPGDVGLFRALGTRDLAESLRIAEAWRPWRSYAAIHLWQRP